MQQLIPTEYVNVYGDKVEIAKLELEAKVAARVTKRKSAQESYHKGWRVVGFAPGYLQKKLEENSARFSAQLKESPTKKPDLLRDLNWLSRNLRKPPIEKPFQLRELAQQCADLATKAGYEFVEVVELKREAKK